MLRNNYILIITVSVLIIVAYNLSLTRDTNSYTDMFSMFSNRIGKEKNCALTVDKKCQERDGQRLCHGRNCDISRATTKPMCKEMFSITKANPQFINVRKVDEVISLIEENMKHDIGGVTEPYLLLADMLPSLLEKNYLNITEGRPIMTAKGESSVESLTVLVEKILSRNGDNPSKKIFSQSEITAIRSYMVAKQKKFSYRINQKNGFEQLNGDVPFIPCRVKSSFNEEEILKCLRESQRQKNSSYHIAFFGDSKMRLLFSTFAEETNFLNYTFNVGVS